MNRLHRNRLHLLFILAASLLSGPARAETPAPKELIAELKKAVAEPIEPASTGNARVVDQLATLLGQERVADMEPMLARLRQTLPPANQRALELIDQLLGGVHAQLAEAAAKQEAAYAVIEKEFVRKIEAQALAAEFDSLFPRLAILVPVESYNNPNVQKVEQLRNCVARWQDYLLETARGNTGQAAQALNDLVQLSSRLPLIPHDHLSHLLDDLSNRDDQAVKSCLAGLVKKLVTLIESARSPADFDALLAELARPLQIDGVMVRIGIGYRANELRLLRLDATRWQDYFSQLEAGHEENADNLLYSLAETMSFDGLYPSAKILARLSPAGASAAGSRPDQNPVLIPPEELTIDTVNQLFILVQRQRYARYAISPGSEDVSLQLVVLRSALARLATGAAGTVITQGGNPPKTRGWFGRYAKAFTEIQADIMRRAITQYLDAPAQVPPAKNEKFDAYCARLLDYGKEQKDWPLVYRILVAQQSLVPGNSPDLKAYKPFIAGMQYEDAGLWFMSYQCYFNAMNASSLLEPASSPLPLIAAIAERMKHLQAEHGEEFARIEKAFTSPDGFPAPPSPEVQPAK